MWDNFEKNFLILNFSTFQSNLSYPDPPGAPELTLEEEAFKGEDVQMTCFLENRGNPDAEHFVWTK